MNRSAQVRGRDSRAGVRFGAMTQDDTLVAGDLMAFSNPSPRRARRSDRA